jgi:hypothetical protein
MDLVTALAIGNSFVETAILVLLIYWFKFDKRQAKKRPRKRKEPTVVLQTVVEKGQWVDPKTLFPKETE